MPPEPDALVVPDWPAPSGVRACTTTRRRPAGAGGSAEFALRRPEAGEPPQLGANRRLLKTVLDLPAEPAWLNQVHGRRAVELPLPGTFIPEADAAFTRTKKQVCVVLTADCLPVLCCDRDGTVVAAVHAGWRGLQQGIVARVVGQLGVEPRSMLAWLGPAIGPASYEVDDAVRDAFGHFGVEDAFQSSRPGHWWMDLYAVARAQLRGAGVESVYGGGYCTCRDERFFSYRGGDETGRMASLIWME